MKNIRYSDIATAFAPHPISDDLTRITNVDSIKRSVRNLILTGKYERRLTPELGSSIRGLLFEPMTPFTTIRIREAIVETIENYEPRAILRDVLVQPSYDDLEYFIQIEFRIEQSEAPVFLELFLERIR
ncbi:MAG: hypothetical protein DDT26_00658 [Dehalococcoidia bacterium]|nr:hypothetical protein [Chloroflexota bacterium]